jgi:hypothetical protein
MDETNKPLNGFQRFGKSAQTFHVVLERVLKRFVGAKGLLISPHHFTQKSLLLLI